MDVTLSFLSNNNIVANTSFSVNERFDLHDERFGSVRAGSKCVVCDKTESEGCYGHHGRLYLDTNVFHPIFLDELCKAINEICHKCGCAIDKTKVYNRRGGKCTRCKETVHVDYFIPLSQPNEMKRRNAMSTTLDPSTVKVILERYHHNAVKYIIDCIAIPPVGIRPPEDMEWPSELSRLYVRLVDLVKSTNKGDTYQRNVSALYNSIVGYLKKNGVIAALSGKMGIFRNLMLGKRLNRSIRLVIAGDPNLDIDEILVPRSIAERVRVPEKVWNGNINVMKKYARDGLLWHKITRVEEDEVIVGEVYDRSLRDGDLVTFNRQPSLSKTSLLAMRLRLGLKETNIFAFNPCITAAFNADFDGDEMNVYAGYGPEATIELMLLCHINRNIYDPLTKKLFVQPIQDVVSGAYLMTKENVPVARDLFDDCAMLSSRWELPTQRTTYALFSVVLPEFDHIDEEVVIENGKLVSGRVDKKVLQRLIIRILEDYKAEVCATFIKEVQLVVLRWMRDKGFSISLNDCIWDKDDVEEYHTMRIKTDKDATLLQNWVLRRSSKYVHPNSDNPLAIMLYSGAKGKTIGPSQMAISLGQQYVDGKKPKTRMKNNSLQDRGFVGSGYVHGLSPKEYFSQASASLSGIIDIGVGVSAIGYTNRRVTKLMAGTEMGYNGNISTDGQIVRF